MRIIQRDGGRWQHAYPREDGRYGAKRESTHILMVETHNHPRDRPVPGQRRDPAARFATKVRQALAQAEGRPDRFTVSHLRIPALTQPWEIQAGPFIGLSVMIEGPTGAAFKQRAPQSAGYFRTFEQRVGEVRGYHKPTMMPEA
jgi:phosphoribosylformylglycinamidine (FGAM) synthase-like enzyme